MKRNKHLLLGAKAIVLLLITTIILSGCKKESIKENSLNTLTNEQKIAKARSWYNLNEKLSSATIQSSKDEKAKLIFKPNWEKATVEIVNGVSVVSTFVNTTLSNFDKGQTKFNLVIKFENESFDAKIVTVKNTKQNEINVLNTVELYEIAFTKKELEYGLNAHIKVFSDAFKQEREERYDLNGRTVINFKLNSSPQRSLNAVLCTDYYYVLDFYDSENNLIATQTTYLGRHCEHVDIQQAVWWIDNGDGTYYGGSSTGYGDSRYTPELQAFEEDYLARMPPEERAIYNSMHIGRKTDYLLNAMTAMNAATARFPNMAQNDTKLDAFRHALFNILNVQFLGNSLAIPWQQALLPLMK